MNTDLEDDLRPTCDLCGAVLTMTPDQAGKHVAVRLDCLDHGPRLLWMPFSDDGDGPVQ